MKNICPLLLAATLLCPPLSLHAISPTFGNINVIQNTNENNPAAVTATLSYSQAALSADGTTSLGTINMRSGSNRGDVLLSFTDTSANDRSLGIMISNVAQLARDNSATGDPEGSYFATSATTNDANGYFINVQAVTSTGPEFNANLAAAWFPYADGWIGGHATNSVNSGPLTSLVGSPGLTLSTTTPGSNVLYDGTTNGVYELNLAGINSQTDGILIVSGGKNEDNYAMSKANADGTWTIQVRDNFSGSGTEPDGLAFVYIPQSSAVSGDEPGVHAMGRLNGNLSRDISAGDYAVVRSSTGRYQLYAPGIDPALATLLLSPEAAGVGGDNIWFYEPSSKGWNMEYRDLSELGLQDNTSTEDTLSFVLMAGANTSAIWDNEAGDSLWGTQSNWKSNNTPGASQDVILGASNNVAIDSPQSAGMVFINRDTAFSLTGSGSLSLSTGLIVNAKPSSSQTYTISVPLILTEDAFIIAQTIGSSITLRLDVASGNAVTAVDKNLTLGGANAIEIRDPISLGTGHLIKEGAGQVTLTAANSIGGTTIVTGPNSTTIGAFRINAPDAYGAFGTGDIIMKNLGSVTALFFDNAAGNGELTNNIVLQSTNPNSGTRFLVDNSNSIYAFLSGLISGGQASSDFIVDSDAANGQGNILLMNTGNTFIAQKININRGALGIYGDGSLGDSSNSIYLNTNNTNGNTGSGLHFYADDITVAATRTVTINTDSVINTNGFQATIAGEINGAGGLMKAGEGMLILPRGNVYEGATSVIEGILSVQNETGSATGTGIVTVFNGATLSGNGIIAGATIIKTSGILSPGNSAGTLTFQAGLDLQAGSVTMLELLSSTSYDQIHVTSGDLQVASSAAFQISLLYTPQAGDTFDLMDWSNLTGDTSLYDNLNLPSLAAWGLQWDTSNFNNLGILSIQLVPEPSRCLLLLGGLSLTLLRRHRVA